MHEKKDGARAMRDRETGKTVTTPPMTFKEWKEKYGSDVKIYGGHNQYGVYNDKNDPDWTKREEHARLYYKEIRQNGREVFVQKISNNTGLRRLFVEKVYNYLFVNRHNLDVGYRLLDESYYMATAFQRLMQGDYDIDDIILLYHERLEWALENRYNMRQREAHEKANAKHDFEEVVDRKRRGQ